MENKLRMCVPCHFGLESVLAYEIKKIGGENLTTTDGKISFEGGFDVLAKANLWIATGERVLIELGSFFKSFNAGFFDYLLTIRDRMNLPLENFIGREDAFPVKGHALNSKLHSIPDCQKIIKKACVKRLEKAYGISYFEETAAKHQIQFAIHKDIATIYLDTSGATFSALYADSIRNVPEPHIGSTTTESARTLARSTIPAASVSLIGASLEFLL